MLHLLSVCVALLMVHVVRSAGLVYSIMVTGDMVSMSGDGSTIAVVKVNDSNTMTLFKRMQAGGYETINVINPHIWIPITANQNTPTFMMLKKYRPQFTNFGIMSYINSNSGYITSVPIAQISSSSPYLTHTSYFNYTTAPFSYLFGSGPNYIVILSSINHMLTHIDFINTSYTYTNVTTKFVNTTSMNLINNQPYQLTRDTVL